jgi:uncharacterized protein YacL
MLVALFRALFALLGAGAGYQVARILRDVYLRTDVLYITGLIAGIIVFGGLGYIVGGAVGRRAYLLLNQLEERIQRLSGGDFIAAGIGIAVAFLASLFVSIALIFIPVVGPYLPIFVFAFASYLGVRLSLKNKDTILSILRIRDRLQRGGSDRDMGKARPKIIDTSVIIDGRIADICKTGFIEGSLIIPSFVLEELQSIADSSDTLKRNRGRTGLDVLKRLQSEPRVSVIFSEDDFQEVTNVDAKLVRLAQKTNGAIVTNDYNLNKVAELQGIPVLNINDLSNAVKPIVLPGESLVVQVIKNGKEADQGVAYLDDGTMIVVEEGKRYVGSEVNVSVTGVLQTPAGRMIFAKVSGNQ